MKCATCRHYRPRRTGNRCAFHASAVRASEWCDDHEPAPRESVDEWIAEHGEPERLPIRPDYSFARPYPATMSRNKRRKRDEQC